MRNIFILVGFSGSGKTSLTNSLDCANLKVISAGKIFLNIAESYNIGKFRIDIQNFAVSYFKDNGYDFFISLIISEIVDGFQSIVIEGIRHFQVIDKLKEIFCSVKVIFIDVKKGLRKNRLLLRDNYTLNQVNILQHHSIEKELINIRKRVDYVVYNNLSLQIAQKEIRKIICN